MLSLYLFCLSLPHVVSCEDKEHIQITQGNEFSVGKELVTVKSSPNLLALRYQHHFSDPPPPPPRSDGNGTQALRHIGMRSIAEPHPQPWKAPA